MGRSRVMALRFAAQCARCSAVTAAGQRAFWDADRRVVICLGCHDLSVGERSGATAFPAPVTYAAPLAPGDGDPEVRAPSPTEPPDGGTAGASAEAVWRRRHDRYEHQMDARWGRFAGIAKLFAPEPQSTKAWAVGAAGERQAAEVLEGVLGADAALLHDRAIPGSRANIDHVAVAASGVWVIDTKHYRGRVERRDRGGWFTPDIRLVMGGRDRSADIEGTGRQLAAVAAALGDPGLPLHAALCLVGAEWSWFAKPFEVGGVHVAAPRDLARLIRRPGPLDPRQAQGLTARLAHRLPAR